MHLYLNRAEVEEWNVIDDADTDTIGFGLMCARHAPMHTLVVQMEVEGSVLAADSMGLYVEMDEEPSYPGVLELRYDPEGERVRISLAPGHPVGLSTLEIELPDPVSPEQSQLLAAMEQSFKSYQRRQQEQSARLLQRLGERFGRLPPTVVQEVKAANLFDLQDMAMRIEEAGSVEALCGQPRRKLSRRR